MRSIRETAEIYKNSLLSIQVRYRDRGRIPEGSPFPAERSGSTQVSNEEVLKWHRNLGDKFNTGLKERTLDKFAENHKPGSENSPQV